MIEAEVKIPIKDMTETADTLVSLGFEEKEQIIENDLYLDNAESRIRSRGEALRIRVLLTPSVCSCAPYDRTAVITFKGQKMDSTTMTREELETGIDDPETALKLFRALGYEIVRPHVSKKRTIYERGNMQACLDTVKGLGDFLELEIMAAGTSEKDEALRRIEEVLKALGYALSDTTQTSYLSMLQGAED